MPDTMSPRLRVMLLEDHLLVRRGMELLLKHDYGMEVVGSFCRSRELFEALKDIQPDVVVTDYALGSTETDGAKLLRALRLQYPLVRILVVSSHCNPATMALAIRAGAQGFIGKTEHESELYMAIRAVVAGRTYVGRRLAAPTEAISPSDQPGKHPGDELLECVDLTAREQEVLRCMLDGMSITAIARKFSRSITTISSQKHSALRKLGLHTTHELFRVRYQRG